MTRILAAIIAAALWSPVWLFLIGLLCGVAWLPKEGLGK